MARLDLDMGLELLLAIMVVEPTTGLGLVLGSNPDVGAHGKPGLLRQPWLATLDPPTQKMLSWLAIRWPRESG